MLSCNQGKILYTTTSTYIAFGGTTMQWRNREVEGGKGA